MRKYLLPKEGNFYKANMHCHSTISDGRMTTEELKKTYMEKGYSIVAFTDHDKYVDHRDMCEENFLAITSFEADISDWVVDSSETRRCYHFCCYDKKPHKDKTTIEPRPNYRNIDEINEYIEKLCQNDFLVCYNHPNWSLQTLDDYRDLKGLFACEIYNHSASIGGIDGNQEIHYDNFLRLGRKMFCLATDDNHNGHPATSPMSDSFGGFIFIKAEKLEYASIMNALENGNFYSSTGPQIKELYVEGDHIHIECSPVRKIAMTSAGRNAKCLRINKGDELLTKARFKFEDTNKYIRFQIEDEEGYRANTNAYFIEDIR